jgi:hypothetical protein
VTDQFFFVLFVSGYCFWACVNVCHVCQPDHSFFIFSYLSGSSTSAAALRVPCCVAHRRQHDLSLDRVSLPLPPPRMHLLVGICDSDSVVYVSMCCVIHAPNNNVVCVSMWCVIHTPNNNVVYVSLWCTMVFLLVRICRNVVYVRMRCVCVCVCVCLCVCVCSNNC